MASQSQIETIQKRVLVASDSELFANLATALPKEQLDQTAKAASLRPSDIVQIGLTFYTTKFRPAIEDAICGKLQFCKNRHIYDTAAAITSLVADETAKIVATTFHLPPEPTGKATSMAVDFAAIVLKEGLNKLCNCQ
jgi:hypothetical protein